MKKLIALLALLCVVLMPFSAMAEDPSVLSWEDTKELVAKAELTGEFYSLSDMGLKIWLPEDLYVVDITEEEAAAGCYTKMMDEEQSCVFSIYAVHVDGMTLEQAYQNAVDNGMKEPEMDIINGIHAVSYESEETNEGAIVLVDTNSNLIIFTFSPFDDDLGKLLFTIIGSSIMPLE